jgi:nucleoside-diphosphate-sugar epimerase
LKVLVTGGRGFLKTHVCAALREVGHDPVALGRADGDLAREETIDRLLGEHEPDVVVHLAAVLPGDERVGENPRLTGLVAAACASRGLPLFHSSTTAVYSDEAPYAASKRAPGYAPLIESLETERLRSLGWRPTVTAGDGLGRTLEWIREAV